MLFAVVAEQFPRWFQDHAFRLESDDKYRNDFQLTMAKVPHALWITTPKWKQTARFRKLINPACERCGRTHDLQAHHKHYRHLGVEILFPYDLIVLCDDCHAAIHGARQLPLWPLIPPAPLDAYPQ
jgi:hypothetical protein